MPASFFGVRLLRETVSIEQARDVGKTRNSRVFPYFSFESDCGRNVSLIESVGT